MNNQNIAVIEKDNMMIDAPEEFLTAVYYSPIKISSKAQRVVARELPKGKEGALCLAAMWKKVKAEDQSRAGGVVRPSV